MPFILPTLLSFQGSAHLLGVGSFSMLYKTAFPNNVVSVVLPVWCPPVMIPEKRNRSIHVFSLYYVRENVNILWNFSAESRCYRARLTADFTGCKDAEIVRDLIRFTLYGIPVWFGTWQAGPAHTGFANWQACPEADLRQFLHRLVGNTSQMIIPRYQPMGCCAFSAPYSLFDPVWSEISTSP